VNPGFGTGVDPTEGAGFTLANTGVWQAIESIAAFTTGTSDLMIIAWLQYIRHPFDGTLLSATPAASRPANVQFGIRVDGDVHYLTPTGKVNTANCNFATMRALSPRRSDAVGSGDESDDLPGPATPTSCSDEPGADEQLEAHSLGMWCAPVRLGCNITVEPGRHTVELVGRRVPSTTGRAWDTDNVIEVYSRRILALESPVVPQATTSVDTVTAAAWETEDSFSAANVGTDRIDAVRTAYNNVEEGACARGCFMHEHLPNAVNTTVTNLQAITPALAQVTDTEYPGFASQDVTTTKTGGDTGWWLLEDGAGDNLQYAPGGGGVDVDNSLIIILANVRCQYVLNTVDARDSDFNSGIMGFTIGTSSGGGAVALVGERHGFVNSQNINPEIAQQFQSAEQDTPGSGTATDAEENIEMDIPLFAFIDNEGADVALLDTIGVYGSVFCPKAGSSAGDVDGAWFEASLITLVLSAP